MEVIKLVNINKLKGKMVEKEFNVEKMSLVLGMNQSTLYRKLNTNGDNFTLKEATDIARALDMSYEEVNEIFFAGYVA